MFLGGGGGGAPLFPGGMFGGLAGNPGDYFHGNLDQLIARLAASDTKYVFFLRQYDRLIGLITRDIADTVHRPHLVLQSTRFHRSWFHRSKPVRGVSHRD
jgi:hypothetical protein